jgi:hypothetical protein
VTRPWHLITLLTLGSAWLLPVLQAGEWTPERIQARIREIRDSDTTGWRKIPWTPSLLDARKASRQEEQPLFLFTHEGNIDTGRC